MKKLILSGLLYASTLALSADEIKEFPAAIGPKESEPQENYLFLAGLVEIIVPDQPEGYNGPCGLERKK